MTGRNGSSVHQCSELPLVALRRGPCASHSLLQVPRPPSCPGCCLPRAPWTRRGLACGQTRGAPWMVDMLSVSFAPSTAQLESSGASWPPSVPWDDAKIPLWALWGPRAALACCLPLQAPTGFVRGHVLNVMTHFHISGDCRPRQRLFMFHFPLSIKIFYRKQK